jgi:glyoxylase-like metal-dependent hydrolase (beta-lactamase superfamily II)
VSAEPEPITPRRLGSVATVLVGVRGGRYPHGNSLLVTGTEERVIVDPSLSLVLAGTDRPAADWVLDSHCHEDHVAGNHLYPDVPWRLHEADAPGIVSLDGLMAIYGMDPATEGAFRRVVVEEFHFRPRPDPDVFRDGDVFDLGGGARVRVLHAPGHTRGHSCFHVEPDDVLYLGDIDLSSFGPYYGDAWSSLEDFERTLALVRDVRARWYATFHHVGVLEGRPAFLERLDRFAAVIARREARLLAFLEAPRTLAEIVAHRLVYRPSDAVVFADSVERRTASQHLARLAATGRVQETEPGRWQLRGGAVDG